METWREMICSKSYFTHSQKLADEIATLARRLGTDTIPHVHISTLLACRQGRNEVRWRRVQEKVWRAHVRTWSLSEANLLLNKVLVTLLGLLGVPIMIWRPGNYAPVDPPRYASACRLVPLKKNDNGIRPIGVGECLRRIIGKTIEGRHHTCSGNTADICGTHIYKM